MGREEVNAYWRKDSRYYKEPRSPEDKAEQKRLYEQAQVIGEYEKSHRVPEIKRLTWWYSDFGSFVPNEYLTPERLTERYNEIMELKQQKEEQKKMVDLPSKETVARLREEYPIGTRVELKSMNDPYTALKPGEQGSVSGIDDTGTVFVDWDSGSKLGLVYGVDSYIRLNEPILENIGEAPILNESEQNFAAWMAVTESSRYKWVEDEIYRLNGRGAMYYTGGEDGVYMRISKDGKLEAGDYEGAVPHIGEAAFKPSMTIHFNNFSDAYKAAMEVGGKQFMVDMFSGSEHQPLTKITGRGEPDGKPSVLRQIRDAQKTPPRKPKETGQRKNKDDVDI